MFNEYFQIKDFYSEKKTRKEKITKHIMKNMFLRTLQMFDWKANDEQSEWFFKRITIRNLELLVQSTGLCGIIKHNDYYYCLHGSLGGGPNWNQMPSKFLCPNPVLKDLKQEYNVYEGFDGIKFDENAHKDVVIIPNDDLYIGIIPTLSYHATNIAEIKLTERRTVISARAPFLLTAPNNNAKADIDDWLNDLEMGELGSIYDKNILQNINAIQLNNEGARNIFTQLLEMEQYEKAAMFNELGLQMNYNMKRESITSSEAQLGEGSLLPLPDNMLACRKRACEELKEVFGLNISVEPNSAWYDLKRSIELEMKIQENEANQSDQSSQLDNENSTDEPSSQLDNENSEVENDSEEKTD